MTFQMASKKIEALFLIKQMLNHNRFMFALVLCLPMLIKAHL